MCYGKSATKIIIPPFFSNVNELNVFFQNVLKVAFCKVARVDISMGLGYNIFKREDEV